MISFGIDIGTTTTRAAAIKIETGPFGKKEFHSIAEPLCVFTPFTPEGDLNLQTIRHILHSWQTAQGLPAPDLGTLLFTGEAQRAHNATEVAQSLTQEWNGLLSAQLNPHTESVLAAYGARAVQLSTQRPGRAVLHIDVGGGTSNLAWIENGEIRDTACLDLGARKWILAPDSQQIVRRTPQAKKLEALFPQAIEGNRFSAASAQTMANEIARLIILPSRHTEAFFVVPWKSGSGPQNFILSLSGGIVDCLDHKQSPFVYGDIGPSLATALVETASEAGFETHLSTEKGRATALGVSAYSFQLSGGSIHQEIQKNLYNVPLLSELEGDWQVQSDRATALHIKVMDGDYESVADQLIQRIQCPELILLMKENLGKALGYYLSKNWPQPRPKLLILDEIDFTKAQPGSPVQTLDFRTTPDSHRIAVTIKSVLLF